MSVRMRRRAATAGVSLSVAALAGVGVAYAGTTWTSYNISVAPLNGSGYSGYQSQATSGATGALKSTSVGGSYLVDARIEGPSDGDWVRDVTDNDARNLYGNDNAAGASVRLQLSNDLTTTVSVQATGTWRSN